jgi:DNA-binding NarL/FixJ family response regulator
MPESTVVVLDDHCMVAQAISGVLSEVAGVDVLAVCTTTAEACEVIRRSPPRLLVLDVNLGGDSYRVAADLLHQFNPSAELLFITAMAEHFTPPADLAAITVGVVDKAQGRLKVCPRSPWLGWQHWLWSAGLTAPNARHPLCCSRSACC